MEFTVDVYFWGNNSLVKFGYFNNIFCNFPHFNVWKGICIHKAYFINKI